MTATVCQVQDCENAVHCRGLCSKHEARLRRHGDVDVNLAVTHGKSKTKTYAAWKTMWRRCSSPNSQKYYAYGKRGIQVCDRWADYQNFVDDMGERPEGMSIDRIDNDGDYEPGNCRWATMKQQNRNRRDNHLLTVYGKTMPISAWHEIVAHDTKYHTILQRKTRLKGWSDKEAVFGKPNQQRA